MARPKNPQPAAPVITPDPITPGTALAFEDAARDVHAADVAIMDSYEGIKAAGHIEALEFMRSVADVALAQRFIQVRGSKTYKDLPYRDKDGRICHTETLEDFCQAFLGKSYRRCMELAQNYHLLGKGLYEQAQVVGFKARDYKALQALPAEDQDVIKEALESESREQVLDILQELAVRNAAERESSQKQAAELRADLEAKDALLKHKTERADKLAVELTKLKHLPPSERWKLLLEQEAEAVKRLDTAHTGALAGLKGFFSECSGILESEASPHTKEFVTWVARSLCESVNTWLMEHGVNVDFQEMVSPEWLRDLAAQQLQGGDAQ